MKKKLVPAVALLAAASCLCTIAYAAPEKKTAVKIIEVKKENDYLFASDKPVPRVVSTTSGINNDAQTKKEQANEALRSLFGKATE